MKITYEFDPYDDRDDLRIVQKASNMHSGLWDLLNYRRDLSKGYKKFEIDEVLDELAEILETSTIDEE